MGFFTFTEPQPKPAPTTERFPAFVEISEFPPYVRNDHVTEVFKMGDKVVGTRAATVVTCFWDDSMGARGEWSLYLAYFVRDAEGKQTNEIGYTWTGIKGLEA